jgi:hypothetical protein
LEAVQPPLLMNTQNTHCHSHGRGECHIGGARSTMIDTFTDAFDSKKKMVSYVQQKIQQRIKGDVMLFE